MRKFERWSQWFQSLAEEDQRRLDADIMVTIGLALHTNDAGSRQAINVKIPGKAWDMLDHAGLDVIERHKIGRGHAVEIAASDADLDRVRESIKRALSLAEDKATVAALRTTRDRVRRKQVAA